MPQQILGRALAGHFLERGARVLKIRQHELFRDRSARRLHRFAGAPQRRARALEQMPRAARWSRRPCRAPSRDSRLRAPRESRREACRARRPSSTRRITSGRADVRVHPTRAGRSDLFATISRGTSAVSSSRSKSSSSSGRDAVEHDQHKIGRRPGAARARDALDLDFVSSLAHARGVDQLEPEAVDVGRLGDEIARRPGNRRHDRPARAEAAH